MSSLDETQTTAPNPLGAITATRKTGTEEFRDGAVVAGFHLLDFWQWSASDLVSNATRGRLAEFIVAKGLGIPTSGVRDEWAAADLLAPAGLLANRPIEVEVKSSAYVQSWSQKKLSEISFSVRKARPFDREVNDLGPEAIRSADVYVFALLHEQNQARIDPFDLDQWTFYVVPTRDLDNRERSQHSITLKSLDTVASERKVGFAGLAAAVREAAVIGKGRPAPDQPPEPPVYIE